MPKKAWQTQIECLTCSHKQKTSIPRGKSVINEVMALDGSVYTDPFWVEGYKNEVKVGIFGKFDEKTAIRRYIKPTCTNCGGNDWRHLGTNRTLARDGEIL